MVLTLLTDARHAQVQKHYALNEEGKWQVLIDYMDQRIDMPRNLFHRFPTAKELIHVVETGASYRTYLMDLARRGLAERMDSDEPFLYSI